VTRGEGRHCGNNILVDQEEASAVKNSHYPAQKKKGRLVSSVINGGLGYLVPLPRGAALRTCMSRVVSLKPCIRKDVV
jgi:hypothetical protein